MNHFEFMFSGQSLFIRQETFSHDVTGFSVFISTKGRYAPSILCSCVPSWNKGEEETPFKPLGVKERRPCCGVERPRQQNADARAVPRRTSQSIQSRPRPTSKPVKLLTLPKQSVLSMPPDVTSCSTSSHSSIFPSLRRREPALPFDQLHFLGQSRLHAGIRLLCLRDLNSGLPGCTCSQTWKL